MNNMEHLTEACWEGYRQVGMKNKGGKKVPNCVPIDEGAVEDLKALIQRKLIRTPEEPTPDFKRMSPEERRTYMGNKAERQAPHMPLRMIAKYGKGATQQQARYALSDPVVENEINEYCPRCLATEIVRARMQPLQEAEYQGRTVPLGKPMRGDSKKFKVFVRDPNTGNVKKVNFGDKTMRIKKSNPARRRSFRARHNCANPGPRTKARFWSCKKW